MVFGNDLRLFLPIHGIDVAVRHLKGRIRVFEHGDFISNNFGAVFNLDL